MVKWKQRLASALIVAMTVGMFPAHAAARHEWVLEEGGWRCQREGQWLSDEIVTETRNGVEHNYYLKEDTYMAVNELIPIINDKGKQKVGFAMPDGELAKRQWLILDGDMDPASAMSGKPSGLTLAQNFNSGNNSNWYYFNNKMEMLRDCLGEEVQEIQGKWYRFDGSGKMLLAQFDSYDTKSGRIKQYHDNGGARVENKWLYTYDKDNPVGWYKFDSNGNCQMATSSDAYTFDGYTVNREGQLISDTHPCPTVEGLAVKGSAERTVKVGESITLTFEAELATSSDVKYKNSGLTKNHDFWSETKIENPSIHERAVKAVPKGPSDNESKECTITFTSEVPGMVTVVMHIDKGEHGVQSEEITINVTAESADSKKDAIGSILDSISKPDSIADVNAAKDSLIQVYGKDSGSSTPEEVKEIKKTWVEQADNVAILEQKYAMANLIETDHNFEGAQDVLDVNEISVVGACLNANEKNSKVSLVIGKTEENVSENINLELTNEEGQALTITGRVDLDISFYVNDTEKKDLDLPVIITVPVPAGLSTNGLRLFHTTDDGKSEEIDITVKDGKITFAADQFSVYSFVNVKVEETPTEPTRPNYPGSSGSGSGGGRSSSNTSSITYDPKKGQVDSVKGIITGSGSGYSSWVSETAADGQTVLWKLKYADGTYAQGAILTREDGSTYEQPIWEKVNGAWYAFGADGYAKSGMVFDEALGGYFYIDINTGMKTGWTQIDGNWYYFNPVSNGKMGIMAVDTTIDGYYVGNDGIWNGVNP